MNLYNQIRFVNPDTLDAGSAVADTAGAAAAMNAPAGAGAGAPKNPGLPKPMEGQL